jgi:hypothetical protein
MGTKPTSEKGRAQQRSMDINISSRAGCEARSVGGKQTRRLSAPERGLDRLRMKMGGQAACDPAQALGDKPEVCCCRSGQWISVERVLVRPQRMYGGALFVLDRESLVQQTDHILSAIKENQEESATELEEQARRICEKDSHVGGV